MWNRLFIRFLSLSFMSFFVIGLLWQEGRRRGEPAGRRPVAGKPAAETARPAADRR
jgi:hypothetical protein